MCEEFERRYYDFAFFDKNYEEAQELYAHMTNTRFIFQTLPFADIEARLQDVKRREGELKKKLATLMALPEVRMNWMIRCLLHWTRISTGI
jgi:hypothetical protein